MACWGGIGVGVWVIGGCALGWSAFGGCAIGWQAAQGGLVAAREFALGSAAVAHHANDSIARSALNESAFFQIARGAMNFAVFINLIWFLPLLLMWQKARRMRKPDNSAA